MILNVLTTTSTSYLLLSSLDTARRHMQLHGRALLDRALKVADDVRRRFAAYIDHFRIPVASTATARFSDQ